MPPAKSSYPRNQALPVRRSTINDQFIFPTDQHLVITTEQHVLSYDSNGPNKIFKSGSGGILAAKETRDGSGTLAIADSQVVVLHQVEHGMERSYRLKGTDVRDCGNIRCMMHAKFPLTGPNTTPRVCSGLQITLFHYNAARCSTIIFPTRSTTSRARTYT
jgi:hypothetical protein